MQLFDMHSHILPEFDDGAKSVEESLTLIESLKRQGVTNICLTPHFYTNEKSVEDFTAERNYAFEKFKPHLPKDINFVLGTEVYITKYLFSNDDLSDITYGNSNYILTEFAYSSGFSEKTIDKILELIEGYGLIPVLPHVERYPALVDDPELLSQLKSMGVIIQTNISNYAKKSSMLRRRKLLKLINLGLIDILGSDTHSMTHNNPEVFSQAVNCITEKCGKETIEKMMKNAEKIFNSAL